MFSRENRLSKWILQSRLSSGPAGIHQINSLWTERLTTLLATCVTEYLESLKTEVY